MKRTLQRTALVAVSLGLLATACGSDEESSDTTAAQAPVTTAVTATTAATETTAATAEAVCPTNLVIQTDWWPEAEHGGTYQLIGPGGAANQSLFTYSGPIADAYKVGGIETVEIRAGGDAIEFQPVQTVMATDSNIYLGYVNTDDAIASSGTVAVTGVATTLEINPQMLMWDPEQTEIDPAEPTTFKDSGARVLHFPGVTYVDWMIAKGYLDEGQSDPNYGGSPDQWIADAGNYIQQGFATNEVFKYNEVIEWKDGAAAPVEYVLIDELGWRTYPAMYTILTDRLEEERACLEVLVPTLQQAWVDYFAEPQPVNDALLEITGTYNNYWTLTPELNAAAVELFASSGIGGNGGDSTYGNFDDARIEQLFTELTPILEAKALDLPAGYTASNAYTNEFIDESIGVAG